MGLSFLRWETIHPALVHVTVGMVPLVALACVAAAATRSARWSFVADVALWVSAGFTVLAFAAGLIANALLFWPSGLASWRWIHLAGGAASTALLVVLAAIRYLRRGLPPGRPFAAAVLVLGALVVATGWVGGEVLAYHAGMAVRGGALGALSPPLERAAPPADFIDAMGRLRAHLAAIVDGLAQMTFDHPEPDGFRAVSDHARTIKDLARWLGEHPESFAPHREHHHDDRHPVGGREQAPPPADEGALEPPEAAEPELEIENYADFLEAAADRLAAAAADHDLQRLAIEAGRTQASCAGCHTSLRWTGAAP